VPAGAGELCAQQFATHHRARSLTQAELHATTIARAPRGVHADEKLAHAARRRAGRLYRLCPGRRWSDKLINKSIIDTDKLQIRVQRFDSASGLHHFFQTASITYGTC
jgi:hypothetical protein